MKLCGGCNTTKKVDLFYTKQSKCKKCVKARQRSYNKSNKAEISLNKKKYHAANKDDINLNKREKYSLDPNKYKERNKRYYTENSDRFKVRNSEYFQSNKVAIYNKIASRKKEDPLFKLSHTLRKRTTNFIKSSGFKKSLKFKEYIGCSTQEIKSVS